MKMTVSFESLGLDKLNKKQLIDYANKFIDIQYPSNWTKQRITSELKNSIWFINANNPDFFNEF